MTTIITVVLFDELVVVFVLEAESEETTTAETG